MEAMKTAAMNTATNCGTMTLAALALVVSAASCGGAVEEPTAPPLVPAVIHGRIKGEVGDCGISGYKTCYTDPVALQIWLLSRFDAEFCGDPHAPQMRACSPRERTPLAQVMASEDGEFTLSTMEGEYRLAVVYKDTLRTLTWDEAHRAGSRDAGFLLGPRTFTPDELFWFEGDPPRLCEWHNPQKENDFVVCAARTTCPAFDSCNTCTCNADLSRSCTTKLCL